MTPDRPAPSGEWTGPDRYIGDDFPARHRDPSDETPDTGVDPRIIAALTDPAVCGYLDESGGRPCDNCITGVLINLDRGWTVEQVLADIARYRADTIARASL